MPQLDTVMWLRRSFEVYPRDTRWNSVPAVYIFATVGEDGKWVPLYVGETGDLRTRLATHEKWSGAQRLGMTHVHTRVIPQRPQRLELEDELKQAYKPRLNA